LSSQASSARLTSPTYLTNNSHTYVVKGKAIAQQIIQAGGKAIAVSGDVTDLAFPDRLINETIKAFGKINIIINNAGYTFDGMLHKTTDKQFQMMLDVHNLAPFRILRAAAPHMRLKDNEPRSIVNVRPLRSLFFLFVS
jgi:3-oxoacyl-[acyl-carrier protein] reductase